MPVKAKKTKTPSSPPQTSYEMRLDDFNQADLEIFLEISDESLVILNNLGKIVKCNQAFLDLTAYDPESLKAVHFLDLFDDRDKPLIRNAVKAFDTRNMNTGQPVFKFETRILTKNGEPRWIEWRKQLCRNHLYCSGRDITEIKTQEKELNRREKQLSQAEGIGRMGHWSWTIGDETMDWSEEIYRIFGVNAQTFNPTLHNMDSMVHREDIARVNQAFQRAVIAENDYDMEFRIKRPDGEIRYIRCEGRCSFNNSGEVIALYGIMQDMTERMLYESDLRKAKEQAEAAYASRTQFLANMSHELRTPLNAIIGFSEMVERQLLGPIGTEKYLEYIAGIRESGQHLLDLISDILDMSKIEAGKYELNLEEINIAKLLQLAIHMMEGRAHESGVKMHFDQDFPENLKIIADRRALLQIMLNLLSNAVKFSENGGKVTLSALEREHHLVVKVIDNGCGIPAHKLASVTRPFEQVSSSYARNHEGSGLGLAISKELTEIQGGGLFIESKVNEGTTVTIRLPYDVHEAIGKKNQTQEPSRP
ncbi:MAG: PAS domain-containing protein [Alphaproteobacteria bacterium]